MKKTTLRERQKSVEQLLKDPKRTTHGTLYATLAHIANPIVWLLLAVPALTAKDPAVRQMFAIINSIVYLCGVAATASEIIVRYDAYKKGYKY
jgi:hypothetical protein